MKKHYIILGLFCLLAIVACSDNDPVVEVNNGNQTEEELPPLPTEVITGSRAMWVSYDPAPNVDANNSSGISSALISWRLLTTCLLYTSPSPRDRQKSRMPSSA